MEPTQQRIAQHLSNGNEEVILALTLAMYDTKAIELENILTLSKALLSALDAYSDLKGGHSQLSSLPLIKIRDVLIEIIDQGWSGLKYAQLREKLAEEQRQKRGDILRLGL